MRGYSKSNFDVKMTQPHFGSKCDSRLLQNLCKASLLWWAKDILIKNFSTQKIRKVSYKRLSKFDTSVFSETTENFGKF